MKYRKLPGRIQQWHYHLRCPEWPSEGFIEHESMPAAIDMCAVCGTLAKIDEEIARRELIQSKKQFLRE